MGMSLGELQELVVDREPWRAVIHGIAKSWTRLSNWTVWTDTYVCLYPAPWWIYVKTFANGEK